MSGAATLVTCHGLDTSGVTPGPCLVISPIGTNKADSFSPRKKPMYRAPRNVSHLLSLIYMQIIRFDALRGHLPVEIIRRAYQSTLITEIRKLWCVSRALIRTPYGSRVYFESGNVSFSLLSSSSVIVPNPKSLSVLLDTKLLCNLSLFTSFKHLTLTKNVQC